MAEGETSVRRRDNAPVPPGVVIVFDGRGQAKYGLKAILPDLDKSGYMQKSTGQIAMAIGRNMVGLNHSWGANHNALVLGTMVGEDVPHHRSTDTAVANLLEGRYAHMAAMQGIFALAVIDWQGQKVRVASDLLGIRPFYVARKGTITAFCDRAAPLARLTGQRIDPVGFSTFVVFHAATGNRTLYADVERIAPSSVVEVSAEGFKSTPYWAPAIDDQPVDPARLMEAVYQDFAAGVQRLLSPFDVATVLLSGGFDSRFILLTALSQGRPRMEAATVPYNQGERQIVEQLAGQLDIPCRFAEVRRSIYDAMPGNVWHAHPDGYPIKKNLTYLAATLADTSGAVIEGSLKGGVLQRHNAHLKAKADPTSRDEANAALWNTLVKTQYRALFRKDFAESLEQDAYAGLIEQGQGLDWNSKFLVRHNLYFHERRYISNNFIQYQHIVRSVHPFVNRFMLERRLAYRNDSYSEEQYRALLAAKFPGPGGLPHADDQATRDDTIKVFCWKLLLQLPQMAAFVQRHRHVLNRAWILPRLSSYALGRTSQLYLVGTIDRLMELERELGEEGLKLDMAAALATM